MSGGGRERRKDERLPVQATVRLRRSGKTSVLPVANISAGGVFLQMHLGQLPGVVLGESVNVYIDFGQDHYGDPLELEVEAEIVRVDIGGLDRSPGLALMWTSSDPAVAQQLALVLDFVRS